MTTSRVESDPYFQLNNFLYTDQINKVIEPILPRFERMMKFYVAFNLFFLILGVIELLLMVMFFAFLVKSAILAFSLAFVFLTIFSYFILRTYFQTKKSEQFKEVRDTYIANCKVLLKYQDGIPEHHIALANSCCKLADSLHGKEYVFYQLPKWLKILTPYIKKFSCFWHWQDVHRIKELLLIASVNENIKLVKCEPASLEVHASLANAYVMLSGLYVDPRKIDGFDDDRWAPPEHLAVILEKKFRDTAERAIEEFKILNYYAPNDPWVHAQLAYSYHDLQMPKEEIQEYECILKLNPEDKETLYKLGVLYFQQGLNAQGLKIYEELKRSHHKRAANLIKYYGAYEPI